MAEVEHCPSCGVALEGERLSTRYKGHLTILRLLVPPEDADGEPVEIEHVCGD